MAILCNFVLFLRYIALTTYIVITQTKNSTWALESRHRISGKCRCDWSDLRFCCMAAVCYVIYRLNSESRPTRAQREKNRSSTLVESFVLVFGEDNVTV